MNRSPSPQIVVSGVDDALAADGASVGSGARVAESALLASGATVAEAAAVVAALEQFLRDTAPAPAPAVEPRETPWKRAALLEGVSREPADAPVWA